MSFPRDTVSPDELSPDISALPDISDPDLYQRGDPDPLWRELRQNAPVCWQTSGAYDGFWSITRYADACRVFKDHETFSSERGIMLGTNSGAGDRGAGKTLSVTDPPWHDRLRRSMNQAFTPRAIQRLQADMEGIAASLLEAAIIKGTCDFIGDVAAKYPNYIICALLGVPRCDWERMSGMTAAAVGFDDPQFRLHTSAQYARWEAHSEIMLYYADLISERRKHPRDDLVSELAVAKVDGRDLTDDEILANCDNFIIGGIETTRSAIAGGTLLLVSHPGQWDQLRSDPSLIPGAVEEVLRWTTPIMHSLRTATRDVEVGQKRIRAGDAVVVWNASANRDETVFHASDQFQIARSPNKHLTLGLGPHYCIGANLVRQEIATFFRVMCEKVETAEIIGSVERIRSNVLRGIKRMPISLRAAARTA